jgi:hypothetical protein
MIHHQTLISKEAEVPASFRVVATDQVRHARVLDGNIILGSAIGRLMLEISAMATLRTIELTSQHFRP